MKKLVKVETGKKTHQSPNAQLGWLIGALSGVIKWNDGLSPDTRKFLFTELMMFLDPKTDAILINHLTRAMDEWGFEVKEEITKSNLLHE